MTWYDAICDLCEKVDREITVKDILDAAIKENWLLPEDAETIAEEVGCGYLTFT